MSRIEFVLPVEPAGPRGGSAMVRIPAEASAAFGTRALTRVRATINGYPFRSAIFPTGDGSFYLVINREVREGAGVAAGDTVTLVLEKDEAPRVVEVPPALEAALAADPGARATFERLSYSHRKEYVDWITEAKREESRQRRVERAVAMLREGKPLK